MAKKKLRIGMVGYGFMGRTHSNAFTQAPKFFNLEYEPQLTAVCARNQVRAEEFASNWGYSSVESDWRALVERDDIDLIDIAAPNNMHHDIAIAAVQAGKMVMCEKPLGRTAAESSEMVAAVEKAGVPNMVWYNYRRIPAISMAKAMIDEGKLGRIYHYRAKFLQDWTIATDLPQGGEGLWRLDKDVAGSGVTGDLLAHCIDTAMWLNGGIDSVTAMTKTFVKEREHTLTGKVEPVEIDDACAFLARFGNGSLATFESTRYARDHKALYTLKSMASMGPWNGTCTTCNVWSILITGIREQRAVGDQSMSQTVTTPIWAIGGCQALVSVMQKVLYIRPPISSMGWMAKVLRRHLLMRTRLIW